MLDETLLDDIDVCSGIKKEGKVIELMLILRDITAEKVTEKALPPSKKHIQKYYEENTAQFTIPEMVRASHIIKNLSPEVDPDQVKEEMHQILWDVRNKNNFDELVAKKSDCPENGGDLGFFPRGQMVAEFEDVVFDMEAGEVVSKKKEMEGIQEGEEDEDDQ